MSPCRLNAPVYEHFGDLSRVREIHEETIRRARAIGDTFVEARALGIIAQFDIDEGRLDEAIPLLVQAHRIHRDRRTGPDEYWDAIAVARFASIADVKGEIEVAMRLVGCCEAAFEELAVNALQLEPWLEEMIEAKQQAARATIGEEAAAILAQEGRKLSVDEGVKLALDVLGKGEGGG